MVPTTKSLFVKSWLISVITALLAVSIYWIIADFGSFFQGQSGATRFLVVLLYISMVGGAIGAGIFGWRVADKYYHEDTKTFLRRYITLSLLSFIVAVLILNTPLAPIAALWSLIAPLCVLAALGRIKQLRKK